MRSAETFLTSSAMISGFRLADPHVKMELDEIGIDLQGLEHG